MMARVTAFPQSFMQSDRGQSGVAAVELAVVLPVLIVLIAFVTDLSLGILARTQVQNAARAGAEFATTFGYDQDGIKDAASKAVTRSVVPIAAASVTVAVQCGCTDTGVIVAQTDTAPNCSATFCASGAINTTAFVTVTVTSAYTPIFTSMWQLISGSRAISASVVGRTARAGA